ncbi:ACT domain-containing protein [Candidatus Woesearchaeota archaeon]|nr:ACT domain-containing protein [Candidatus Woesearchaeota archaeon]
MPSVKDLKTLLESMNPQLIKGKYVFCTVSQQQYHRLKTKPLMLFKETEGITLILQKSVAEKLKFAYTSIWAMITLTVHSDLNAVGFLAAITAKLAQQGISVNAVSAYYHDHLFVPFEKAEKSMALLKKF